MAETKTVEIDIDGDPLRLMYTAPAKVRRGGAPAVLLCCGLTVRTLAMDAFWQRLTERMTEGGLAVASFELRCRSGPWSDRPYTVADHVRDAEGAWSWLAGRDDVNAERIGLLGHALAGIIASTLAGRMDQIARLALLSTTTTEQTLARLTRSNGNGAGPKIDPGALPTGYLESLTELTPLVDVGQKARPTLIVHGAADCLFPPELSYRFLDAARQQNGVVEHELIARADHDFTLPETRDAAVDRLYRFFVKLSGKA